MMPQQGQSYAGDSEALQADVMRFMAIIAFCLIAILALVRNVEPAAEPVEPPQNAAAVTRKIAMATPESIPRAVAEPETTLPEISIPEADPEPPIDEVVTEQPVDTRPPPAVPEQPADTDIPEQSKSEPAIATTVTTAEAALADGKPAEEEEGLTLRFASDSDFLRLITRGDIRVYAFQGSDVLALNESYRFLDTTAPGQVYELLPPSIPRLVVDALREARPETDGYRWGIALPGHISHQIERHLDRVTRGELVIDRYGDVRHVAAS